MITFLWMLYIALMLFGTIVSVLGMIEERESHRSSASLAIILIFTCLMWAAFIVYYLN